MGMNGSAEALFLAGIFRKTAQTHLIILPDRDEAGFLYNDLVNVLGESEVLFLPSSYKRDITRGVIANPIDNAAIIMRTEVLNAFRHRQTPFLVVTYPSGLAEKVVSTENLAANTLHLKKGEKINVDFLVDVLVEYDFQRVDFVYEAGQFAVRGGIVDVFSFATDYPVRVDFFGTEVDSIRTFDAVSQLSIQSIEEFSIIPNLQLRQTDTPLISLLQFVPEHINIVARNLKFTLEYFVSLFVETDTQTDASFLSKFSHGNDLKKYLQKMRVLEMGQMNPSSSQENVFRLNTKPQKVFNKNFELLIQDLTAKHSMGFTNVIVSDNNRQIERLNAIFREKRIADEVYNFTNVVLHNGFVDSDIQLCCYTDHQIFERYHGYKLKPNNSQEGRNALTMKELTTLQPGDFVVHIDHGVARFGGLEKLEVNGKIQEAIKLVFQDNDTLFVNIHSLHRISKFKGKDAEPPRIHKLGSAVWQKLKQSTKSKVKDIARELIALYAQRHVQKGFAFSKDTYLQHALESSFLYEDTPDQYKATLAVKMDMESDIPMDRLVCGDVGFGKTEVAIRAAFKAVTDGKQVAVLVPTTILAFQHHRTFSERLKQFSLNIEYLSRNKKGTQLKDTLAKLKSGKIDIIIGTHRLISKDVEFKDLGLLVIDEEQKFGVGVKEKLKALKLNVDTLTLTATPIPRTLQFSLMGARDLSIINTPPPNRYPIITELHTYNTDIISEAIKYELNRGGQVFFIHNRIANIYDVEQNIRSAVPGARTVVAHGQMNGDQMEDIILDFMDEKYDVLVATSIIENGLDIPNANTIIINDAHHFGLSDLHQLRGRVGRSNKKAFCYLLAPPQSVLSQDARKRLQAISYFTELGSGFQISLQDLDIRGAGNMLGAEQSGFIAEIGFETYKRILDEALLELREDEFNEAWRNVHTHNNTDKVSVAENNKQLPEDFNFVSDCVIDTDLEVLIPDDYIENIAERLQVYRDLDSMTDEAEIQQFEINLKDRFGKIPASVFELFQTVRLRKLAMKLAIEKIVLKKQKLIAHFTEKQNSIFYDSPVFGKLIAYVQQNDKRCQLKDNAQKLSLLVDKVHTVSDAYEQLMKISKM